MALIAFIVLLCGLLQFSVCRLVVLWARVGVLIAVMCVV